MTGDTPGGFITTKAGFDRAKVARGDVIPLPVETELIERLVNMLLTRLYDPYEDGWRASKRIEQWGLHHAAINWGDLSCCDVTLDDSGTYTVLIEEVAPDATHLQAYIASWLTNWGWPVMVRTAW